MKVFVRLFGSVVVALIPAVALAADPACDQLWTAYKGVSLPKAERPEGMAEESYRYFAGATLFATTYERVKDMEADAFIAESAPNQMMISLGLKLGDGFMTCYVEEALADPATADFAAKQEATYAPEDRAEIVARFRLPE